MSYLIMECHEGYAVALTERGEFRKVANRNYEVGQKVPDAHELQMNDGRESEPLSAGQKSPNALFAMLTVAACLLACAVVSWNMVRTPYGAVHLAINPEVEISVNRWDYVVGMSGENPDGKKLIAGYDHGYTKIDQVADELADRAARMGFLKDEGMIRVSADSADSRWKADIERHIVAELKRHTSGKYCIATNAQECQSKKKNPKPALEPEPDSEKDSEPAATPAPTPAPEPTPVPASPDPTPAPASPPAPAPAPTPAPSDDDEGDDDWNDDSDDGGESDDDDDDEGDDDD